MEREQPHKSDLAGLLSLRKHRLKSQLSLFMRHLLTGEYLLQSQLKFQTLVLKRTLFTLLSSTKAFTDIQLCVSLQFQRKIGKSNLRGLVSTLIRHLSNGSRSYKPTRYRLQVEDIHRYRLHGKYEKNGIQLILWRDTKGRKCYGAGGKRWIVADNRRQFLTVLDSRSHVTRRSYKTSSGATLLLFSFLQL